MTTRIARNGKPYAGNPSVRFREGEVVSAATARRLALFTGKFLVGAGFFALAATGAFAALQEVELTDWALQDATVIEAQALRQTERSGGG